MNFLNGFTSTYFLKISMNVFWQKPQFDFIFEEIKARRSTVI